MYRPNERMEWTIKVDNEKFISLKFVGFNVYEHVLNKCERDYVLVHDVDLVGERTSSQRYFPFTSLYNRIIFYFLQVCATEILDGNIEY